MTALKVLPSGKVGLYRSSSCHHSSTRHASACLRGLRSRVIINVLQALACPRGNSVHRPSESDRSRATARPKRAFGTGKGCRSRLFRHTQVVLGSPCADAHPFSLRYLHIARWRLATSMQSVTVPHSAHHQRFPQGHALHMLSDHSPYFAQPPSTGRRVDEGSQRKYREISLFRASNSGTRQT